MLKRKKTTNLKPYFTHAYIRITFIKSHWDIKYGDSRWFKLQENSNFTDERNLILLWKGQYNTMQMPTQQATLTLSRYAKRRHFWIAGDRNSRFSGKPVWQRRDRWEGWRWVITSLFDVKEPRVTSEGIKILAF